jgi:hypothetical protein
MTGDRDEIARRRFAIFQAVRVAGVPLMIAGLWIWVGDAVRPGGLPALGIPLFLIGSATAFVVPQVLARRWRTPDA